MMCCLVKPWFLMQVLLLYVHLDLLLYILPLFQKASNFLPSFNSGLTFCKTTSELLTNFKSIVFSVQQAYSVRDEQKCPRLCSMSNFNKEESISTLQHTTYHLTLFLTHYFSCKGVKRISKKVNWSANITQSKILAFNKVWQILNSMLHTV